MTISATRSAILPDNTQWLEQARTLGRTFAERAAAADEDDIFVADNFAALKANGFLSAGVPAELGGGGASQAELCTIVRELARHCGSTGLAFSMHTHQVAVAAWRWRHLKAPVEGLLGETGVRSQFPLIFDRLLQDIIVRPRLLGARMRWPSRMPGPRLIREWV